MILLVIALTRIYAVSANNQINFFERTLEEPTINVWRQTIDVPESKNIIHKFVQMGKSEFIVPDLLVLINKSNGTNCK